MHSILIPHRNRQKNLAVCINALNNAAANSPEPVEAIVYDQSELINRICLKAPHLKLRWIEMPQDPNGPYRKAKALNDLISRARGYLITILDADMVCQPHWIKAISEYFAQTENHTKKLGHRVRLLDAATSKQFYLAPNYVTRYAKMSKNNPLAAEQYDGITTGNAILTMTADNFIALSGYSEDFVGYGLEDWEFNLRAQKNGITTDILTTADLYHLHHNSGQWGTEELEKQNQHLFQKHLHDGFPIPPRPKSWDHDRAEECCFRSTGEGFELHPLELE